MVKQKHKITTSERHQAQVLSALDRIAGKDELAFLTTQRVSQESKISNGVLFRHFSSKENMLLDWVQQRGDQLQALMDTMPAGREGLLYFLQCLLQNKALLNFVCCQPMDIGYLRLEMDKIRHQMWQMFNTRIAFLASSPANVSTEALTDHLSQSIYRAWDANHPQQQAQQELLMNQLPWKKTSPDTTTLPAKEALQRLALNDSGFVFDPVSGLSFTANAIGLYVLRFLQKNDDADALFTAIEQDFEVSRSEAERDLTEFFAQVRKLIA